MSKRASLTTAHFVSFPAGYTRRRMLRVLGAAGMVALLGACATPGRISGEGAAFERTGRFAVTVTEAGRASDAVQGGFAWRDSGPVLRLDLTNPLGSTLARIVVEPRRAVLEQADGTTESAPDADALLEQVVGASLPVANLREWMQGRAGPGEVSELQNDAQGRPESFVQQGWNIRLSRYDALGPGLLRVDRSDGPRRISVRLALDTPAE